MLLIIGQNERSQEAHKEFTQRKVKHLSRKGNHIQSVHLIYIRYFKDHVIVVDSPHFKSDVWKNPLKADGSLDSKLHFCPKFFFQSPTSEIFGYLVNPPTFCPVNIL